MAISDWCEVEFGSSSGGRGWTERSEGSPGGGLVLGQPSVDGSRAIGFGSVFRGSRGTGKASGTHHSPGFRTAFAGSNRIFRTAVYNPPKS